MNQNQDPSNEEEDLQERALPQGDAAPGDDPHHDLASEHVDNVSPLVPIELDNDGYRYMPDEDASEESEETTEEADYQPSSDDAEQDDEEDEEYEEEYEIEDEELEQDELEDDEQDEDDELDEYEDQDEEGTEEDEEEDEEPEQDELEQHASARSQEAIHLSKIEIDHERLPVGMLFSLDDVNVSVDALAGRCSSLGFGGNRISQTVHEALENLTTDSAIWMGKESSELSNELQSPYLKSLNSEARKSISAFFSVSGGIPDRLIQLSASADLAIDNAISMARRLKGESCYRTIAIAGSDHGRTGMCRSATGIPEVQERFGPMMAGFTHVPMGDEKTFTAALDEQTACVLISPINLQDSAIPCDAKFLLRVRELCDQQSIPLIIDETQVVFGASGSPATFQMLANITPDLVIFSAGLFNGITGALTLGSAEFAKSNGDNLCDFPLQTAILLDTLQQLDESQLIAPLVDDIHPLAIKIAEAISGFEFVRDINATGLTIGIESDIESSHVVATSARHGLRLATAGPTAVCLQPPLLLGEIDQQALIDRISCTMETLEREFSDTSL